jgi:hypothetical protein
MNHHRLLSAVGAMICLLAHCADCFGYSGGTGTVNDPFQISTVDDWKELTNDSANWDKSFILTVDIDLRDIVYDNAPIAPNTNEGQWEYRGTPFTGTFDGNRHVLFNLSIDAEQYSPIGLFGFVGPGGRIKNLRMENADIQGRRAVAGLAGRNEGTITFCHVTGTVIISGV